MSIDGYIDDATERRLILSNQADLDRVDELRASCDAILVGANTIRRDDPALLLRSTTRRAARVAEGRPGSPHKVTVTATGDLDASRRFFAADGTAKIVYCAAGGHATALERFGDLAVIVPVGDIVDLGVALTDLYARGVRRLLVEGGTTINTQLLTAGLVDDLQLAIAPVFVGDSRAPRFAADGDFTADLGLTPTEVRRIGEVVLVRWQARHG